MIQKLTLWENGIPHLDPNADTPNVLTVYLLDDKSCTRPCVVIYPGGGYSHRASHHEGEMVAGFFNSRGYHAAVVEYRVAPNRHPAPLADAQRAIRLMRHRAKEWGIDPDRILTLGFSAGGHLCASTLVCEDAPLDGHIFDEIDAESARPNGGILCYPVISVDALYGHVGSGKNLLGDRYESEKDKFDLATLVTEKTPKTFLWHTSNDGCVNVKNSLVFAEHLRDCGVPFEMHIYPNGPHGLGLAPDLPDIRTWAPLAADWIERNF